MECLRRRIASALHHPDPDFNNLLSLTAFPSSRENNEVPNCPVDRESSDAAILLLEFGSLATPTLAHHASAEDIDMCDLTTDWFCWFVEGVLILVVGCFGLLGNSFSLVLFSRQKVHRIFHNLLLTLTIFDLVREQTTFS